MVGAGSQKKMNFYLLYKIAYIPDHNPNICHFLNLKSHLYYG